MNKKFMPMMYAASFALMASILPFPYAMYMLVRVAVFGAAIYVLYVGLSELSQTNKVVLGLSALIYNPVFPVQLGSRVAWGAVAAAMLVYFAAQSKTKVMK